MNITIVGGGFGGVEGGSEEDREDEGGNAHSAF